MEFTEMQAQEAARSAGIDLEKERFDLKALTAGMNAELEHGTASPDTNITNDVPDAPLILGGAAHSVAYPAALLSQVFEGGNLKALGLLPLSLQQGALCGLHLDAFPLFRGCALRGHYFDGLQAVSRPL